MRRLVLALLATSPAYAAQPYCALPAPVAMPVTDVRPAPVPSGPIAVTPAAPSAIPSPAAPSIPVLSSSMAALPFIRHVLSKGATVMDLGASHNLHTVAARSGDQFMVFQVLADGQAAVSGAMTDLSLAQLRTIAGDNLTELPADHGLRGFYVRSGQQFQVFYATADEERVIPGVMYDAAGSDLTRKQVADIPGVIPTVEVGSLPPDAAAAPAGQALPLVQKASAGTVGPSTAPHLWMLVDPQCIYSIRAYQSLQPYVDAGRLQLTVIPVSILDHEDGGQSTKSALALLSKPADQMVTAWRVGDVTGVPSPDAARKLRDNTAVANAIRLQGTPTLIWRKTDGSEGRVDGIPTSIDLMLASIGH